ncbi:1-acyl-sn-glycerol-3-phosphate acyltransferase [bacterium]|nr:1-acyl-sn-glycerol-3-phosphate acyltransferase [bacterium]
MVVTRFCRVRYHDPQNVPARGGVLVAGNHASFFDPPLVGICNRRHLYYMARKSLFAIPIFGRVCASMNAIPVERGAADLGSIRTCIRLLRRGGGLVVFPEGTRTDDGTIKPFKSGFVMMAARAQVPIVPVAICGSYDVWSRHRVLPAFPGKVAVRVAYGEPIDPPGRSKEACVEASREVESRVRALYAALQEQVSAPSGRPGQSEGRAGRC